ncbi:MAG: tRNA pseudouridine(55) synthase TruB [bacterium]|nr:tRNA pseudouridine(55) synthase TruB [Candidatus Kapabacteria bacterium]
MNVVGEHGAQIIGRDDVASLDTTTFDAALLDPGVVLLVDKPKGWTSFDVVAKCRGIFRVKKIGHTGTLDPMATGLLILCIGRATKLVDSLQATEKEYFGTMLMGATTSTDDAESDVSETFATEHLNEQIICSAAQSFVGEIQQMPPMFSARKVAGQRMYKLARRGEVVEVAPRAVTVSTFEITLVDLPRVGFRVVCSKGTYIRSLARDLGRAVESGAHLTELRRTRSGTMHVAQALTIEELQSMRRQPEDVRGT